MNAKTLEKKMRKALKKAGKSQADIDKVVPFILSQPYMQTDEARLRFFNQWKDKV